MPLWRGETTPPEPVGRDEFVGKTAAELERLVAKARAARRFVAHRICSDEAACRHCAPIRDTHRLIDDHLDQLDTARLEDAWEVLP